MKFRVSSTQLLERLQTINRVISNKSSMPILDHFLFELNGDQLTMTAADMETSLVTSISVQEVEGEGKVALMSKLLVDTLREFPEEPLSFEIDDKTLAMVITSTNGVYRYIGMNGDLYPQLESLEKEDAQHITTGAEILEEGITKTFFCTADDELRPIMNGIYFDIRKDELTLVATDAHKLAQYKTTEIDTSVKESERIGFILPKKPATILRNILPKESGKVAISFGEKNAHIKLESYTMICRLIEGKYPNYEAVIPQNNPFKVITDRQSFFNSVKRVAVFSNQASNLIKIAITNNQICISAQDIDFSISAEENISCQYEGEPIRVGFKSTFLAEMLSNLECEEILLELGDHSRAGIIRPFETENTNGAETLMLLMPMTLND